jgi:hypothetical protein
LSTWWLVHSSTTCGAWRARRGGGRPTIRGLGRDARRARSVALREAVQSGVWDADAVANALLGAEPRLF